jgi:DNA-binding NarL/FixJ family response regulator
MTISEFIPTLRILVVDDHAIVREGLVRVLSSAGERWAIAEAASGHEALERLRQEPFQMAIVDLSMPGMSGLDLIKRIKQDHPRMGVLVLSMHTEEQYAMRAFKAGANGYVTKDGPVADTVAAVRKVAAGGAYVSASLAERLVLQLNRAQPAPGHASLTDRELDVLRRIVAGHNPGQIATALHLSVKTISSHKRRILDKLQLPNTAALVRYGLEHGLNLDVPRA